MNVKYIIHEKSNDNLLLSIAKIKQSAWPYSTSEQLEWIKNNIKNDDIHVLLLNDNDETLAYLNIIKLKIIINGKEREISGIGNVCAINKGIGLGTKLMENVNDYLIKNNLTGLLFCQNKLVDFYERFHWTAIDNNYITIKQSTPKMNTLIFNFNHTITDLLYDGALF